MKEFGQRKPVVVKDGIVIAGSGTLQAMDLEGYSEIAAVPADDLNTAEAKAYALADNQSGDLAEWDPAELAGRLAELPDSLQPLTGFDADELQAIAKLAFEKSESDSEATRKDDAAEFATIKLTREQYVVIQGAVAKVQQSEGADVTVGRALELICAEFLS